MKRASYRHAVQWIALNDDPETGDNEEVIADQISVVLVADLFGVTCTKVAADVARERRRV